MHHVLIMGLTDTRRSQGVPLLVLMHQVEPQADDDNDQQAVAAEMGGEGDEVAGLVPAEEDLRTWRDMEVSGLLRGRGRRKMDSPMALPVDQMMKLRATATLFLVWPATLRDSMDRASVWADQKESVM
jgi:hypothetical protein